MMHALVDARPAGVVVLRGLRSDSVRTATSLSTGDPLDVSAGPEGPVVRLPDRRPDEPVHVLRLGRDAARA